MVSTSQMKNCQRINFFPNTTSTARLTFHTGDYQSAGAILTHRTTTHSHFRTRQRSLSRLSLFELFWIISISRFLCSGNDIQKRRKTKEQARAKKSAELIPLVQLVKKILVGPYKYNTVLPSPSKCTYVTVKRHNMNSEHRKIKEMLR